MFPLRFLEAAQEDLFAAVRYYESRRPGLGDELLDEVERALRDVREHPKR